MRGVSLVESLIAILVFSVGLLTVIAMYAVAMRSAGDAQYRAEAAAYATDLLQQIAANVGRTPDGGVVRTGASNALEAFALNGTGGGACAYQGGMAASAPRVLQDWVKRIDADGTGLPGASAPGAKRVVIGDGTSFNHVVVTVCWQAPGATGPGRHEVSGYVN